MRREEKIVREDEKRRKGKIVREDEKRRKDSEGG